MSKNGNWLLGAVLAGLGLATLALFVGGADDAPPPALGGPQVAERGDGGVDASEEGVATEQEAPQGPVRDDRPQEAGAEPQDSQGHDDDLTDEGEDTPTSRRGERGEPVRGPRRGEDGRDAQADGLAGRLGGDVDDSQLDPVRERRDDRSWESRYAAVDEALVQQVPALSKRRERAMRQVLARFRDARRATLGDLQAGRIDRDTMRERARSAHRARDRGLRKVLTPAQYATLDFDDAHFEATK